MMVVVDHTRSMSQVFGGGYTTKLAFAKAAASRFISEANQTKDLIGLAQFTAASTEILSAPITDKAVVAALVPTIAQTQQLTSFFDALTAAIESLDSVTADRKVLLIISDGEDTDTSYSETDNPIALCDAFKSAGGIVICLGGRAHDRGFALLSTLASGGFFLNGYPAVADESLDLLSGLKGYLCAGNCNPVGDEYVGQGTLSYADFLNWDVSGGNVDLQGNGFFDYLPGNGLYVDLGASAKITTKDPIPIEAGQVYTLSLKLAGNQVEAGSGSVRI